MSYYPEPDSSHIRDRVKVVLDLYYATKKELDHENDTSHGNCHVS